MANNGSLSFSAHLLDGLDLLYKRTEDVLKSTSEIGDWFKKIALIQEKFSKSLTRVGTTNNISKGRCTATTEMGTVKCAWISVHQEMENLANKHLICAQSIMSEVSNKVFSFYNDKSNIRKKLVTDGQKMTNEYKNAIAAMVKAKSYYDLKCKEADIANQALQKAKNDCSIRPKKINELSSESLKALDIANEADKEYQRSLQRANEKQTRFYEIEMPSILEIFQAFEEERIQFLKDIFDKFAFLQKDFPVCSQDVFIGVSNASQIINVKSDIQQFIEQSRTGVFPPPPIEYQPFVADGSSVIALHGSVVKASDIETNKSEDPISLIPDDRIAKLQFKLNDIKVTIEMEEKTKKGMEKLVKFYSNDLIAKERAKNDLLEQRLKIRKLKKERYQIEYQIYEIYKEVNSLYIKENNNNDNNNTDKEEVRNNRAKVLFDYESRSENELNLKENEIVDVLEKDDDSGWYFASLNGKEGFIPSNYIKFKKN